MALPNLAVAAVVATLLLEAAAGISAYQVINQQPNYRNVLVPPQTSKDAEKRDYR